MAKDWFSGGSSGKGGGDWFTGGGGSYTSKLRKHIQTNYEQQKTASYINPSGSTPNKKPAKTGGSNILSKVGHIAKDIVGGVAEAPIFFARGLEHVPQAIYREVQNKPITDIQKKVFGTTNTRDMGKKLAGETALLGSLAFTGGTAGGLRIAAKQGIKTLAKKSLPIIESGAAGGGGYTLVKKPTASGQEVLKGAALGAGASLALPAGGALLPKTAKTALRQTRAAVLTKDKSIISQAPTAIEGDMKQPILNRDFVAQKYRSLIDPVKQAAKDMSRKDIALIDKIEIPKTNIKITPALASRRIEAVAKKADNPEQFKTVVGLMRDAYNTRLAGDVTLGRDVGFRHNYLPHIFDTADKKTKDVLNKLEAKNARVVANLKPGYTKPRTVETYAKAEELGLKRKNANAIQDFEQSMNAAGYEHGSQALRIGLEQAHPGQVAVGKIGKNISTGEEYHQLQIAGGKGLSLPKSLAAEYNKRAPVEEASGLVGKYDKANAGLKYAKLGGGLFHALTETGNIAGQQLTSLNLFRHPIDNLRVVAGTLSRKAHDTNWQKLGSDELHNTDGKSTLDRMALSGVTTRPEEILADINVKAIDKMKNSRLNFIKNVHDMIFQRQIPEGKALIFRQATKGLDSNVPEDLAKMRDVASAVNNMGGIKNAVEGLTPATAKKWSRILLARDFTEGRFRTIGHALTKGGEKGKIARQMIIGKSILFALPGLTAAVASGKLDPSDTKAVGKAFVQQVLDPRVASNFRGRPTKSNPGGVPKSIQLPRTFVSEIARVIAPALNTLNPDKLSGAKEYAHARLAALPATGEALATNQDFFGNPLYGTDKQGNPIPKGRAALNIAGQGAPIPAVQASKIRQQTATESVLNTAGFRVSSNPQSVEGQHSRAITDFYNTYNTASDARTKVSKQITTLVMQGKVGQATRLADQWNESIYSRIRPFKDRYKDNYNPAWDKEFSRLVISVTPRAFKERVKAGNLSQSVLR